MAALYSVTSGSTATAAAGLYKIPVAMRTNTGTQNRIVQVDVTFDGANSAALPVLVEFVKTSGSTSGGLDYVPNKVSTDTRAAADTDARINDTVDGTSPVVQQAYFVPPTSGISLQFPLGREPGMTVSEFWEVRVKLAVGQSAVNYLVNVVWEE